MSRTGRPTVRWEERFVKYFEVRGECWVWTRGSVRFYCGKGAGHESIRALAFDLVGKPRPNISFGHLSEFKMVCNNLKCIQPNHVKVIARAPKTVPLAMDAHSRFWRKVHKRPGNGCWVWTGTKNSAGYGIFHTGDGGKKTVAHRWLKEREIGRPLPRHIFVCHHCDNPPCVRPDHMFIGDNGANVRDAVKKGRHGMAARTHCPLGHPYSGDNLLIPKRKAGPARLCRKCMELHCAKRKAKRVRIDPNYFKLTAADAEEIRRIYRARDHEFGSAALARQYGCSRSLIFAVVNGHVWRKSL